MTNYHQISPLLIYMGQRWWFLQLKHFYLRINIAHEFLVIWWCFFLLSWIVFAGDVHQRIVISVEIYNNIDMFLLRFELRCYDGVSKRWNAGLSWRLKLWLFLSDFFLLFLVVAVLELINQMENGLNLLLLLIPPALTHISFDWLEFSKLKYQLWEIYIAVFLPLSSFINYLPSCWLYSWWSYMKLRMMVKTDGLISLMWRVEFFYPITLLSLRRLLRRVE